jgi:LAS superfamily LD-carboxypeptidase LdcB
VAAARREIPVYYARRWENSIVNFAASAGIVVKVTSRYRTDAEQAALYAAKKTTVPPGLSQHNHGFAFDLVPTSGYQQYDATFNDALQWLAALATYYGAYPVVEEANRHVHVNSLSKAQFDAYLAGPPDLPFPR